MVRASGTTNLYIITAQLNFSFCKVALDVISLLQHYAHSNSSETRNSVFGRPKPHVLAKHMLYYLP